MLILPPGHWQSVAAPRQLRRRDKWLIGSVLGLVALLAGVLVVSFASTARTTSRGCIDVTVQAATGGTELYRCGAEARALCGTVGATGATGSFQLALAGECRKAGLYAAR